MKMLILFSGGLDSAVLLHKYKEDVGLAISFSYGAKNNAEEIKYAKHNCNILGIKHQVIDLDLITMGIKSNMLTSGGDIPLGTEDSQVMIVPFRNGIMLAIAAGIAESNGLDTIAIASHYMGKDTPPDNKQSFRDAMSLAIKYGTHTEVSIFAPFINIYKRDIALIGKEIGFNFADSYSCYKGEEFHCGICEACLMRKEALQGFDNTIYV